MLTLEYLDKRGVIEPQQLEELLAGSAPLLERAKMGEARYAGSLGWLDPDKWAGEEQLARIEACAARVREMADVFVLVGVGGSNNAARSVIEALAEGAGPEIVYMGNTLSPHAMRRELAGLAGKRVVVNCIAKNFETLEPGASFRVLRSMLEKACGEEEAARRIIATGTPGSALEQMCTQQGYEFFAFPTDIGGRYTALSSVGLLPMAVAGIDVRAVVAGARRMREELFAAPAAENTALRYAALRYLLYQKGYRMEMLASFEPQLRWFYKWWTQLFAESEGKAGGGLFPVTGEYSEELHSVGQYVQDGAPVLFETFLDVAAPSSSLTLDESRVADGFDYLTGKDFWQINKAAFAATRAAHAEKLPCLTLGLESLDAAGFGALFYFFQFACYLSGGILGIDPFDQPGVEAYKAGMFRALGKP